ncbi:hypothetical protein ERUR111494_06225 [Erysipelothrix urinaevulpis]|uniref:hypothetical protein n=1 Tax=Erysipelothrix urinaevulpis TaxID=2683717 RepID=UPI0013581E1A|nr:hypothetical protein [Erysipelothrix urinaevulpis]
MKETVWINKSVDEVWDFVELEFAKVFKCSPKKLHEKTLKIKHGGKEVIQSIPVQERPNHLVLLSEDQDNVVETHYKFIADDNDGSFLEIYEEGKGKNSTGKTIMYKVLDLPLLRTKKRKRLRQRIESIKYFIELEDDQNDDLQEA